MLLVKLPNETEFIGNGAGGFFLLLLGGTGWMDFRLRPGEKELFQFRKNFFVPHLNIPMHQRGQKMLKMKWQE